MLAEAANVPAEMLTEVLAEKLRNGNFGGEISGLVNADIL
jgi:hypothetical protein